VNYQMRVIKRSPQSFDSALSTIYALAYCISLCSIVILPLTWIDIAKRSLVLKRSQTSLVIGWSIISVLVVLVMELPFFILTTLRFRMEASRWSLAVSIGWVIIFTSIIVLNSFALILITRIKRTQEPESGTTTGMLRLMRRIQISSIQLVIASVCSLFLSFLYHFRAIRGYYQDPRCFADWIDLAFRCSQFPIQYSVMVAIWFVAPSAYSLMKDPSIADVSSGSRNKTVNNISPEASRHVAAQNDEEVKLGDGDFSSSASSSNMIAKT